MATSNASSTVRLFVTTTPANQSVREDRKLIRSHVMRGKNRKKLAQRPLSWMTGNCQTGNSLLNTGQDLISQNLCLIPAKVGDEFSFTVISKSVSEAIFENITRFTLIVKQRIFPAELGLIFKHTGDWSVEPWWNDIACYHFTVFVATTYFDHVRGTRSKSITALNHLVKTLAILQQRLSDRDNGLSTCDSTILVVIGLTTAANTLGDSETAKKHIAGLHKMVKLRGGLSRFNWNKQLQIKICRVDLEVALSTGNTPLFFSDQLSWNSYIASHTKSTSSCESKTGISQFLNTLETRLRLIWDDVAEFARCVNLAMQCNYRIDSDLYQETMVSIHYRLVNLRFDQSSIDEIVRLSLLAYASTIFLQFREVKTRYEYLSKSIIGALSRPGFDAIVIPTQFKLWLHIVAAICCFDEHEQLKYRPRLAELLQVLRIDSWVEVRSTLKTVLWIGVLHDSPAKRLIEKALSRF